MQTEAEVVNLFVQRIVETVHPLKIVFFGSYARGQVTSGSDIDVLVVMPEGVHRRQTAQFLYRQIKGVSVPFDILVATPDDLQKHKDNIGLIYRAILREGREIYVE